MIGSSSVRRRTAVSLVALAGVVLAGCSSSSSKGDGGTTGKSQAVSAAPANLRTVTVSITSDSCTAQHASYNAGALTFQISNKDATGVSELEVLSEDRILGEKENLPPGFSGTFSLNLQPGSYTLYCPGASKEKTTLTVTGNATSAPNTDTHALLVDGAKQYKDYVVSQVSQLVDAVNTLNSALQSGNLQDAQNAYMKARPYYERIEPVAESFPNLDDVIDFRINDVPAGHKWQGFHPIERALFEQKSLKGLAALGAGLVTNVGKLQSLVNGLSGFQPAELANGAVGLLEEAGKNKIKGEEERYSHIDMLDFAANVEGSEQAFAFLEQGMQKIDPTLTSTIKSQFANVTTVLDGYKDTANTSGYKLFTALTPAETTKISQALQAVFEPLSRVAGKVVNS